jgi:parallel beta-helix repeat protein
VKKFCALFILLAVMVFIAACSDSPISISSHKATIIRVSVKDNVQQAVDNARAGDVVLIAPGTYSTSITITRDDITVRGEDRNKTIFDGAYSLGEGIVVKANGVRVENLTVQKYTQTGIDVRGTKDTGRRYSIQFVNSMNNALYGINASGARDGIVAHNYSRANTNAGIHFDSCEPCRTLAYDNIAETNGIGLQVEYAKKSLFIFQNTFDSNRMGIDVHLSSAIQIVGNRANENNSGDAPTANADIYGYGIRIAGSTKLLVQKNRTDTNATTGIFLTSDGDVLSEGNTVKENYSRGNGFPFGFDLAYIIPGRPDVMSSGNCFEENDFSSQSVDHIEESLPCEGGAPGPFRSQPLKKEFIPKVPAYSDVAVESQNRVQMEGKTTNIPEKLTTIVDQNLNDVNLPDE